MPVGAIGLKMFSWCQWCQLSFLTDQSLGKLEVPISNYSRLWVLKIVLIVLESPVWER